VQEAAAKLAQEAHIGAAGFGAERRGGRGEADLPRLGVGGRMLIPSRVAELIMVVVDVRCLLELRHQGAWP
jgi:hypothetical protein